MNKIAKPKKASPLAEVQTGNLHNPPGGMEEMTEAEFAKSALFMWRVIAHEHRWIKNHPVWHNMHLVMFHMNTGNGVAMTSDRISSIRVFRFGCPHVKMLELTEKEQTSGLFRIHSEPKGVRLMKCATCGFIKPVSQNG